MSNQKNVSLDEMIEEVQAKEALISEPTEVSQMITAASMEVIDAANTGKVKVLTDYDADGITSAYIIEKLLKSINPDCEIEVKCNDRRGSYGLSLDIQGDGKSRYIVCDMGSNQLDLARERLGQDVIIFDHHLIENESIRNTFASLEPSDRSSCLCNPHALHTNDNENAQYCAAGLVYRAYQEAQRICQIYDKPFHTSEKQDNTVAVMACIGTAADMVDVFDLNGYNRQILKDGLALIDNADENNLDFVIGNVLARNDISDGVTAHQLAFNVGAFLNSSSRMSEISGENGAQRMYMALTADEHSASTYHELDRLDTQNSERKAYISQLTSDDSYKQFVHEHRFGDKANDNIGVYQLPDNVPAAFAGLVAGKLAETTDKAIICVTYSESKQAYTGSGRNPQSNETSLKSFIDSALSKETELFGEAVLQTSYGGHENAVGISSLNDIVRFQQLIDKTKDEMKYADKSSRTVLDLSLAEMEKPETLAKVKMLEPTGIGFELPPVMIEGVETFREKLFKGGHDDWKAVRVKDTATKTTIDVSDWSYSPEAYPQTAKKEIAFMAELSINDYKGQHIELTAKPDRAFLAERIKEIEQIQPKKKAAVINKDDRF